MRKRVLCNSCVPTIPREIFFRLFELCVADDDSEIGRWQLISKAMREMTYELTEIPCHIGFVPAGVLVKFQRLTTLCLIPSIEFRGLPLNRTAIRQLPTSMTYLCLCFQIHLCDIDLWHLTNLTDLTYAPEKDSHGLSDALFFRLTALTNLSLNKAGRLTDDGLSGLTNLTHLELTDNALVHGQFLQGMTRLRSLELCNLSGFSGNFLALASLTRLDLFDLPCMPAYAFMPLTQLVSLHVGGTPQLNGASFYNCISLTDLYLCGVAHLGTVMTRLTALRLLDLRSDDDQRHIHDLKYLSWLTTLRVADTADVSIRTLGHMKALKEICVHNSETGRNTTIHIEGISEFCPR